MEDREEVGIYFDQWNTVDDPETLEFLVTKVSSATVYGESSLDNSQMEFCNLQSFAQWGGGFESRGSLDYIQWYSKPMGYYPLVLWKGISVFPFYRQKEVANLTQSWNENKR